MFCQRLGVPSGPQEPDCGDLPWTRPRVSLTGSEWMRKRGLREASSSAQGHQLRERQSPHSHPRLRPRSQEAAGPPLL